MYTKPHHRALLDQDYAGSVVAGAGGTKKASATAAPAVSTQDHSTSERARIATVRSKEAHPHSGRQQQHKAGGPPHHGHIPEAGGAARSAATSIGACERAWSEQKSSVKEAPQDLQHPRRR